MRVQFSSIISVYKNDNPDHFLSAVKSLLNQTLKPHEVIILIDGSISEDMDRVVGELSQNSLIRVVRLSKNIGRGQARDRAIKEAKYDLIAMMDADDISVEDRFQKQIEHYLKTDADVIGGYIEEFINSPGDLKSFRRVPLKHEEIVKFAKWRQPMNHPTIVFKREAYLKIGGYKNLRMLEDFDLFYRMIASGMIFVNIPDVLVQMRYSRAQQNRRSGFAYFREEYLVLKEMYKDDFLSSFEFIGNIVIRFSIRMLPLGFARLFYKSILRK